MHLYIKSFLIAVFMSVTIIVPLLYSQQINSYVDEKGVTIVTDQEVPAKYKKAARSVGYSTPATSAEKAAWEAHKAKDEEDRLKRVEARKKAEEEARKEERLRQVEEKAEQALRAAQD